MVALVNDILALAAFIGLLYAPFHVLDQYATREARANARKAIREGQALFDTRPLASLLDRVFGPKHFTVRCFLPSVAMSLVFTTLFLGLVDAYMLDVAEYVGRYNARIGFLKQAQEKISEVQNGLIGILEDTLKKKEDSGVRRELEKLKEQRATMQKQRDQKIPSGTYMLAWMILSVAVTLNVVCDYLALWKTRIILRRVSAAASQWAIAGYVGLDLLLAVAIWAASGLIFVYINAQSFIWVNTDAPLLTVAVATVSLATTIATSIWIYTYLLGSLVSAGLGKVLRRTSQLIDPKEHPFHVIGIVGTIAMTVLIATIYSITKVF